MLPQQANLISALKALNRSKIQTVAKRAGAIIFRVERKKSPCDFQRCVRIWISSNFGRVECFKMPLD